MSKIQIVENCQKASRTDLVKMLVSVQNILDSYNELHERMNRAPMAIRLFIEEHGGRIESLAWYKKSICDELGIEEKPLT